MSLGIRCWDHWDVPSQPRLRVRLGFLPVLVQPSGENQVRAWRPKLPLQLSRASSQVQVALFSGFKEEPSFLELKVKGALKLPSQESSILLPSGSCCFN